MRISRISIQNFKAFCQQETFDVEGKNVLIYGNNGSGKSSFYYALHVFLQSSIKKDEQRKKYFASGSQENLRNLHAPATLAPFIRVTLDSGQIFEMSEASTAGMLPNTEDVVVLANEASDFMNYRFLYDFSNFRNSQDADIFPILRKEFFPFWRMGAGGPTFSERYEELRTESERLINLYRTNVGNRRKYGTSSVAYKKLYVRIGDFGTDLKLKYAGYIETINELLELHFLKGEGFKLLLDEYQPMRLVSGNPWAIRSPKLIMRLSQKGKPIPKPHIHLNEARMNALALAIRMAVFQERYKGTGDFKILVVDDLLLSLDMSNRMKVINYLLDNPAFKSYQKFILTHDKGFYNILENNLVKDQEAWKHFEFYENPTTGAYRNPLIIEREDALAKAERLLKGNPSKGIAPQLEECALYLRRKTEELVRIFYDTSLENLSRFHILEKLSNSLAGMEKEIRSTEIRKFESAIKSPHLTVANIKKLKDDPYIPAVKTIPPQPETLAINNIKFQILDFIETFVESKEAKELAKTKILSVAEKVNEIRDRILNHGAHPTTDPLFTAELAAAIASVKDFEETVLKYAKR